MKKIFLTLFLTLFISLFAFAEETYTLRTGISIDKVPKEFYGTWRVASKIASSSNPEIFKKNSVDLWNLSRVNNVITLDNPFSGAKASITLDEVSGRLIKFKKIGDYNGKKLTDTVELILGKETFTGTNTIKLDTISALDGHVTESYTAIYKLTGEKISGESIK